MTPPLPIFRSHYSFGGTSLLTLDEPGRAKPGNPLSVFDLAAQAKLSHVHVHDRRIDGYLAAYKAAAKAKVQLCYGLTLTVCADMGDRTPESRLTESRATLLFLNSAAYGDATKVWSRAWGHEGSFTHRGKTYGRADWALLKQYWTPNLGLALPFFSSFVARNTLTMARIAPDLPAKPWVLREVGGADLPFAPLIDAALDRYTKEADLEDHNIPMKTVLYPTKEHFRAYTVFRAMENHGAFEDPKASHLASDQFGFDAWQELAAAKASSQALPP